MKPGDKYFVRIDKKLTENQTDKETFDAHIEYVKRMSSETELYAGGFKGVSGGMIIFKAKNFLSADTMCKNDPIVVNKYYDYELHEWDILLTS